MKTAVSKFAATLMTLTMGLSDVGMINLLGMRAAHAQANLQANPMPPRPAVPPPPGVSSLEQLLRQIQEQGPPVVPSPPATQFPVVPPQPASTPSQPRAAIPSSGGRENGQPDEQHGVQDDEIYRLGAGDTVRINIFDLPDYSGEYQILVDGSLTLPRIGRVVLAGLTLDEAGQLLTDRYSVSFVQPLTTVALSKARPLRLAVSGEVTRPGSYSLSLTDGALYPSVTDLVKAAGGITQNADLRNVQVVRRQQLGEPQSFTLNLWDLVLAGDLKQDITLRDGDSVVIPATTIAPSEVAKMVAANLSPDTMQVGVIGEVKKPGILEVRPNTSLNQALLAAGGFDPRRARRGSVRLLRLNPDGTASDRRIEINFDHGINEQTNPLLRPNDVVLVSRSTIASFGDAMESLLGPLTRIIGSTLSISNFILQVFGGNNNDNANN